MAVNDGNIVKRTSQYIDNLAFDESTGLPMVELGGTDGTNIYRAAVKPDGSLVVGSSNRTMRYQIAGSTIYVGDAPLGSATSDPVWNITRFDTSAGSGMMRIGGVWDNRASEVYS